jgi:hypothetical protein
MLVAVPARDFWQGTNKPWTIFGGLFRSAYLTYRESRTLVGPVLGALHHCRTSGLVHSSRHVGC